jgi:primosomal protein N''
MKKLLRKFYENLTGLRNNTEQKIKQKKTLQKTNFTKNLFMLNKNFVNFGGSLKKQPPRKISLT